MLSCPCRKRSQKKAALTRMMLSQAFAANKLLKGKNIRLVGGSSYYAVMPTAALTPLLPAGMNIFELAGTAYYPEPADVMDIVPPTQNPAPNPPLTGSTLTYKWPSQIFGKKAALFIMGKCDNQAANWGDVNEGSLGDCWLMAGIAAIARYGIAASLFTNVVGDNPPQVTITLCQQDGPFGSFQTQFPITVTTQIPVDANNKLIYVYSDSYGEYWPCLLEKAVASVLYRNGVNGYSSIVGGYTSCGIGLFAPGYALQIYLNTDGNGNITSTATDLQNAWKKLMQAGNTVDVSFVAISDTILQDGQRAGNSGLLADHAYTLFALVTAPLGTSAPTSTTPTVTLALLRNPYGHGTTCSTPNGGEWSGQWSDCDSTSWSQNPYVAQACAWDGQKNDGLFWMDISDIMANMVPYYGVFMPTNPTLQTVDLTQNPLGGSQTTITPSTTCVPVSFNVQTKKHPEELAWSVPGTNYFAAAGTYLNPSTAYSTSACLEPGTYTFVASDTYGTGWNGGNFSITVNGKQAVAPTKVPSPLDTLSQTFTVSK